jgi:hypothetical protein
MHLLALSVLFAIAVSAVPMLGRLQKHVGNRMNNVDAVQTIDELAKMDVAELGKIIKTKATLMMIFRRNIPLASKVFYPTLHYPDMCFGVHVAMQNNWTDVVEKYYRHNRCKVKLWDRTNMAIWGSHLAYFEHRMKVINENRYQEFFDFAAKNGELHMLQTDLKEIDGSLGAMNRAALNGHIAVVKWLHDEQRMRNDKNEKTGCSGLAMACAAHGDNLEIVQFLFEHCYGESDIKTAIGYARCLDHIDILRYLLARTSKIESISTEGKYERNKLEMRHHTYNNCLGFPLDEECPICYDSMNAEVMHSTCKFILLNF